MGERIRATRANVRTGDFSTFVEAVDIYDTGQSWVGAYNLSGGLWEWTSSIFAEYPYESDEKHEDRDNIESERILRGGSWDNYADTATGFFRGKAFPTAFWNAFGFRCARDYSSDDNVGLPE